MDQKQIDTLLALVRNLEGESSRLAENVELLDSEASDAELNGTLARGIMNIEDAIRTIRQERHDDLLW